MIAGEMNIIIHELLQAKFGSFEYGTTNYPRQRDRAVPIKTNIPGNIPNFETNYGGMISMVNFEQIELIIPTAIEVINLPKTIMIKLLDEIVIPTPTNKIMSLKIKPFLRPFFHK